MSFKQNRLLSLHGERKITLYLEQTRHLSTVSTRRNFNCIGFLPKYEMKLHLKVHLTKKNKQKSLLNCVPCVPACPRAACQRGLRANVSACQRTESVPTSHFYVLACQSAIRRANVSTWRANVPITKWNVKFLYFFLLLCKKFYICICIVHNNCIILHFYTSRHIKEKYVEFFFFLFFFLAL